jgi:hypothetical protein
LRGLAFAIALVSAAPAGAQSATPLVPRVEVGGGAFLMGGLYWFVDLSEFISDSQLGLAGMEVATRITLATKIALEGRAAFSNTGAVGTTWYDVAAVIRTPPLPHKWTRFFRLGVGGHREVEDVPESRRQNQDHSTTVFPAYTHYKATPPNLVVGGIGFQRGMSQHLAVAAEADLFAGPGVGLGGRVSVGVLIPLGAYGGH